MLVLWRIARLLRERDLARRGLTAAAARDAIIARIGRLALDERSTPRLLDDAGQLLAGALAEVSCTIVPVGATPQDAAGSQRVRRFRVDDGVTPMAEIVATSDAGRVEALGENEFLDAVAALLSAAVKRRTAEDQLRHDALHDPLTGLANRVLAIDRLTKLLARREATYVTVVYLDLDGFKAIHDSCGHDGGDRVLCDLAGRLRDAVRADDTVGRLAGDEFVVLAACSDVGCSEQLVSRLLAAATCDVFAGDRRLPITASVGVAKARSGTIGAEVLLHRADAAMCRAKNNGGGASWARRVGRGPRP